MLRTHKGKKVFSDKKDQIIQKPYTGQISEIVPYVRLRTYL